MHFKGTVSREVDVGGRKPKRLRHHQKLVLKVGVLWSLIVKKASSFSGGGLECTFA
jgi:hypothetical protein